jgi:hypothetical protein
MTIALLCPNGHRLLCPEQQAGKRGKCPQCGATFRVPELSSVTSGPGSSSAMPILVAGGSSPKLVESPQPAGLLSEPEPAVENPIRPYEDGEAVGDNEIVFLCPEGHHLRGPTTLGGGPGECPTCGIKFLVPTEQDLAEHEPVEEQAPGNPLLFNFDGPQDTVPVRTVPETTATRAAEAPTRSHLADLFDSLWAYKAEGATIELHLGPGKVLIVDGYAAHLSRHTHGVFMLREPNGSHTIAAVNWDAVSHVAVRGVRRLPEGVFE